MRREFHEHAIKLCDEYIYRAEQALERGDAGAAQAWNSATQMLQYLLDDNHEALAQFMTKPEQDVIDDMIFAYANRAATCPYWEVDEGEVVAAKGMLSAYELYETMYEQPQLCDPAPPHADVYDCGPYCKYMAVIAGYPGEHGLACTHPQCRRILEMRFNRSEVE